MLLCECAEEESMLVINPGGYQAWLTTLGGLKDESRLSWREGELAREVPMGLAGNFFDEAMQTELTRERQAHDALDIELEEAEQRATALEEELRMEREKSQVNEALLRDLIAKTAGGSEK